MIDLTEYLRALKRASRCLQGMPITHNRTVRSQFIEKSSLNRQPQNLRTFLASNRRASGHNGAEVPFHETKR